MSALTRLFRNLFRRTQVERELDEDINGYLQLLADEKLARGMSNEEAWRQARLEIGETHRLKEDVRDVRTGATIEALWRDARYTARGLRRAPVFTITAIAILALGIGANTAVFSAFSAVLLRPLPYAGERQIVAVWEKRLREDSVRSPVSAPDFLDWRRLSKSLSSIALYDTNRQTIAHGAEIELAPAARVTAGFFESLGVQPLLGRAFSMTDEERGRPKVAILTFGAWQRRFSGDPRIVGKRISIDAEPFEIIGILPEAFRYPFAAACELFVPIRFTEDQLRYRGIHSFDAIARLRDGVTLEQASSEMEVISKQIERENVDSNAGHVAHIVPLREELAGRLKPALSMLLAAVFLLILISSANVASLLLARASVRRRETTVRAALGCSRARLLAQTLMESSMLAAAGALAGVAVAWYGIYLLKSAFFERLEFFATPSLAAAGIDWRVLLFALGCALFSTLLFGGVTAFSTSGGNLNDTLRSFGRGATPAGSHTFRGALVVVQVALSVMLLAGAGLLGKSFINLMNVDLGLRPEGVTTASIRLPLSQYRNLERAAQFYESLVDQASALPGVRAAGVTDILPLSGGDNRSGIQIQGREPRPGERFRMHPRLATPGYLDAMSVQLRAGRSFTEADTASNRHVAIVNEIAARRYWPDGNAVGQRFRFTVENAPWLEVIGVTSSIHNRALDADTTPDVYLPFRQHPFPHVPARVALVLKSSLGETSLAPTIRQTLASLDRSVAVADIRSMQSYVDDSAAPKRLNLILLVSFAAIAIVLAGTGLYGILSYLVSQRTSEIGIRVALGAGRLEVLRIVMGHGLALSGLGLLLGVVVSLAATRLISTQLFGVHPNDPSIFLLIPICLLAVALFASYLPARRAVNLDPLVALRLE